jgi:hypothetical protein
MGEMRLVQELEVILQAVRGLSAFIGPFIERLA